MRIVLVAAFSLSSSVALAQVPLPIQRLPVEGLLPAPPRAQICLDLTVFDVRAGATAPGNGTPASPFPTITAAFARARETNVCRLQVRVAAGSYAGDLEVTRPTEIVGASRTTVILSGGLLNRGPNALTVRRATLRTASAPAVVSDGAATTTIEEVSIVGARHYGIKQRGGNLVLRDVRVEGTQAGTGDRIEGTGIHLSGNVRADLTDVLLERNASAALIARGAGVRVVAHRLTARDTGRNPNFPVDPGPLKTTIERVEGAPARAPARSPLDLRNLQTPIAGAVPLLVPQFRMRVEGGLFGFAAVEISDGATVLAEDLRVERSALFGLVVVTGARANVRRLTALATQHFEVDRWSSRGGNNVVVSDDAILEASDVESANATGAGFVVYRAWLTLHGGNVHHNPIGIAILEPHGDPIRCVDSVRYSDNEINADFGYSLPVPTPTDLDGTPPPPPECGSVPWTP